MGVGGLVLGGGLLGYFKIHIPKPEFIASSVVSFHIVQRKVVDKKRRKKPEFFAAAVLHTAPEPTWNEEESIHHCCLATRICYMATNPAGFITPTSSTASMLGLQSLSCRGALVLGFETSFLL